MTMIAADDDESKIIYLNVWSRPHEICSMCFENVPIHLPPTTISMCAFFYKLCDYICRSIVFIIQYHIVDHLTQIKSCGNRFDISTRNATEHFLPKMQLDILHCNPFNT